MPSDGQQMMVGMLTCRSANVIQHCSASADRVRAQVCAPGEPGCAAGEGKRSASVPVRRGAAAARACPYAANPGLVP